MLSDSILFGLFNVVGYCSLWFIQCCRIVFSLVYLMLSDIILFGLFNAVGQYSLWFIQCCRTVFSLGYSMLSDSILFGLFNAVVLSAWAIIFHTTRG